MTLNVVGIVCALAAEARPLGPATGGEGAVATLADGTLLALTGMGGVAAAGGARALVDGGATALVSWGLAGALDPALAAGLIFLPSEVIAPDGRAIATARPWRERLAAAVVAQHAGTERRRRPFGLTGRPVPVVCGKLLTSDRAIGSVADKAALFRMTGASAVDMESSAIAEVARSHRLPFIAVRVIVDRAEDALPQAVIAAADGAGHLRLWRLLGALARGPADLGALYRLALRYRAASRSLGAVARASSWANHVSMADAVVS